MPRETHDEADARGLTQELAEYLGEDPEEIERQAEELEIEEPWAAEKDSR